MIRKPYAVRDNNRPVRGGVLLFEVLVAMFVFLVAMVAIGQYLSNALRSSTQGTLRAKASIFCESKLNELLATSAPLGAQEAGTLSDDLEWSWEYQVTATSAANLQQLTVTMYHQNDRRGVWSLSRLFRPLQQLDAD